MRDFDEPAHRNLCDFTRFQARLDPGCRMLDEAGIIAVAGAVDFPAARTAVRSDRSLGAPAWVDKLTAFLDADGKTGCAFARVGIDDDLNDELTARNFHESARTPEMVCDHPLEAREPPDGVSVRMAGSPEDVRAYARIAGEAFTHQALNGYVGWVACVDAARGRGLGDVVTRAVTNEAFARGSKLVTLEASQFGESTYARVGYREIYRYRVLIRL